MTNQELSKQFEEEFEKLRKELKLKHSLDDFDHIFYLRSFILKVGHISNDFSRVICSRILDTYASWSSYFHGLLVPNTSSMISIAESQLFDEKEKEKITRLMNSVIVFSSKNTLAGLTKDKKLEAQFLNESVTYWNETFKPSLVEIMKKVNDYWTKMACEK